MIFIFVISYIFKIKKNYLITLIILLKQFKINKIIIIYCIFKLIYKDKMLKI